MVIILKTDHADWDGYHTAQRDSVQLQGLIRAIEGFGYIGANGMSRDECADITNEANRAVWRAYREIDSRLRKRFNIPPA